MNSGRLVFSQLTDFLPKYEFDKCVERYAGNRRIRTFSCQDQFYCMIYAQLTGRESLRDIETTLRAMSGKLYRMGVRGKVSRSTLADANERRDWRIYADYAQVLIGRARRFLFSDDLDLDLEETVYAFDATTIDLCLSLFPWAHFRRRKAAIKLHTLMDLRGSIPCFLYISDGRTHDVRGFDQLTPEPGAYYVMDRAYVDFARLYRLTEAAAFFVTRAKRNLRFDRKISRPVDKAAGLRCDQTIFLHVPATRKLYPAPLRRVTSVDQEIEKRITLLSNNFQLDALVLAKLYKYRWRIELFFKWVKQNLRIRVFLGTSSNAVKTQIWIALCVYLLLIIVKNEMKLSQNLSEIHQILSVALFEQIPVRQLFTTSKPQKIQKRLRKSMTLFDI